jgi:basic amino acid/polyamine antiporter, APA family
VCDFQACLGALNGWMLVSAEVGGPHTVRRWPVPPAVRLDRPQRLGLVMAAPLLLLLWRYASSSGLTLYTYLIDLDVVAVSVPYLFSACAQLTFLVSRRRRVQGWLLARDLLICGVSVLFSLWITFASGYQAVYQALILVLAGIVLYAFLNARRERLGRIPEPDNPPDDTAAPVPADTQREPAAGKGEM